MKKIISLFKRDYEGNRQVYDEVVPGAEWVIEGKGVATVKYDGTCCMIKDGQLYKRYDRKLTKSAAKRRRRDKRFVPAVEHFKPAPEGWVAAEPAPDPNSGHWPGWLLVGSGPEDRWHAEAMANDPPILLPNGTYEFLGPKVQGNPYNLKKHILYPHGGDNLEHHQLFTVPPRTFIGIRAWLRENEIEGIVWHHPDGRMVKIKRRDFGFDWPCQ